MLHFLCLLLLVSLWEINAKTNVANIEIPPPAVSPGFTKSGTFKNGIGYELTCYKKISTSRAAEVIVSLNGLNLAKFGASVCTDAELDGGVEIQFDTTKKAHKLKTHHMFNVYAIYYITVTKNKVSRLGHETQETGGAPAGAPSATWTETFAGHPTPAGSSSSPAPTKKKHWFGKSKPPKE